MVWFPCTSQCLIWGLCGGGGCKDLVWFPCICRCLISAGWWRQSGSYQSKQKIAIITKKNNRNAWFNSFIILHTYAFFPLHVYRLSVFVYILHIKYIIYITYLHTYFYTYILYFGPCLYIMRFAKYSLLSRIFLHCSIYLTIIYIYISIYPLKKTAV